MARTLGRKIEMHAITVILDKKDSVINVIICESNNALTFAIKQIVFDLIDLFIDNQKCSMDNAKRTNLIQCVLNPLGFWTKNTTKKQDQLPSFRFIN